MIIKKKNNQIRQNEASNMQALEPKEEKTLSLKEAQVQEIPEEDFSTLDFKERDERRRGDRRRGYRRIDERTLVSRAQEEAENIRTLASREGYKSGMQEAADDIINLKSAIKEFLEYKNVMYEKISQDILELSIEVAKRIMKKEVELGNDVLKNIVLGVFDEIDLGDSKITVTLNSKDVKLFRETMPEILETKAENVKITLISNDEIEEGSCKVTTNNGVIDASFSTQLQLVSQAFKTINP